jgi:hypothetical protein
MEIWICQGFADDDTKVTFTRYDVSFKLAKVRKIAQQAD